jgi:hypothetical protein
MVEIINVTLAFLGLLFICGLALDFARHASRFLDR